MGIRRSMREIESAEFAARLGTASTRHLFIDILGSEPALKDLRNHLEQHPEAAVKVLRRVRSIGALQFDPRYEHPHDTSLAAYLWVLSSARSEAAGIAAELILRVPQTWWARQLAVGLWQPENRETERTKWATADFGTAMHTRIVYAGQTLRTLDATSKVVPSPLLSGVRRFTLEATPKAIKGGPHPAARPARWTGIDMPLAFVVASVRAQERTNDLEWEQ